MYTISYDLSGNPVTVKREKNGIISFIPIERTNSDFVDFLYWNEQQPVPLDWETKIEPKADPLYMEFEKPIKASDFIVASPKPKTNPKEALFKAVGEARKGHGVPKSSMTILLNLIEYIDDLEKRVDALEKAKLK